MIIIPEVLVFPLLKTLKASSVFLFNTLSYNFSFKEYLIS